MKTLIIVLFILVILPAFFAVILIAWILSYNDPDNELYNELNEMGNETEK